MFTVKFLPEMYWAYWIGGRSRDTWDWTNSGYYRFYFNDLSFYEFIPIPALDGGTCDPFLYEMISGRAHQTGFPWKAQKSRHGLLLALMFLRSELTAYLNPTILQEITFLLLYSHTKKSQVIWFGFFCVNYFWLDYFFKTILLFFTQLVQLFYLTILFQIHICATKRFLGILDGNSS